MAQPPVAIVCVGMAGKSIKLSNEISINEWSKGSGKTTFMQRINSHLFAQRTPPYVMNLDPAVMNVPFSPNIDIRDVVNYKEVMKQYSLGPNGGILTSLNLFATKVDQVLALLEKRCLPPKSPTAPSTQTSTPSAQEQAASTSTTPSKPIKHIIVDTPGQIEVFVWSASGAILLDAIASSFPTVIAYIIDTPRTTSTSTFMSNMLYACSILYKTKLPMILVFNKTDVQDASFASEWMTDFEAFQAALEKEREEGSFGGIEGGSGMGGSGYMGSLLNSMSLTLEEFYRHLDVVGVSSVTGHGVNEFFEAVEGKRVEFERDYQPELERRKKEREAEGEKRREKELGRLMKDMNVSNRGSSSTGGKKNGLGGPKDGIEVSRGTLSDLEDDDDEEMVGDSERDEDDEGDEDGGIQRRYQQALGKEDDGNKGDEHSFARYVKASGMGGM